MDYRDLSDRNAVLKAITECDTLGRKAFLSKYGFGRARNYLLIHGGKQYDSKAIVGAAYRHQFDRLLTPREFAGGKHTVRPKLESLGFRVVALKVDDTSSALPEEVPPSLWEGARRSVTVNTFERSPDARLACIEHHGTQCVICGFDFGEIYGEEFAGFIHVHHLVPLSQIGAQYKVNPVKDLVPVCPNCHAVLHYGGRTSSIEAVRKLLRRKDAQPSVAADALQAARR